MATPKIYFPPYKDTNSIHSNRANSIHNPQKLISKEDGSENKSAECKSCHIESRKHCLSERVIYTARPKR